MVSSYSRLENMQRIPIVDIYNKRKNIFMTSTQSCTATAPCHSAEREEMLFNDATGPLSPATSSPFFLKWVTRRISVCQGKCGRPTKAEGGGMFPAPYDLCVARKERWWFISPKDEKATPTITFASPAWRKQIPPLTEL